MFHVLNGNSLITNFMSFFYIIPSSDLLILVGKSLEWPAGRLKNNKKLISKQVSER
jgi:hypothetical protein